MVVQHTHTYHNVIHCAQLQQNLTMSQPKHEVDSNCGNETLQQYKLSHFKMEFSCYCNTMFTLYCAVMFHHIEGPPVVKET